MKNGSILRKYPKHIRHHIEMSSAQRLFSWQPKVSQMTLSPHDWIHQDKSLANGANVFLNNAYRDCLSVHEEGGPERFPPQVVVEIKALACELPYTHGIPLSRFSIHELRREAIASGIVAQISGTTIWRWLHLDAIRPWQYRSWIFPRDPDFLEKASRVLDLYEGFWKGKPLSEKDYVLSADEKTSIQARIRKHQTLGPQPNQSIKVEHEYKRGGALTYLAAWDVHRAKIFGRMEPKSGIASFARLVAQVMNQEPYRSASRVYWIVDNGSSHRGQPAIKRLQNAWPNAIMVHLPIHASWLNQIEIYFSVIQRKVLTPNDLKSLNELKDRILRFQKRYEEIARPFEWKFTRKDLKNLIDKISNQHLALKKVA
jgi:hypothetical protein